MTAFSDEVIAALNAPLAREHVHQRDQAGRKVSYIEGWHVIAEANRIFGFDGWSRETVMSECCYAGEYERPVWENGRKTNKTFTSFRCTYRARVRIRVGHNIVREGSGHGNGFADNPGDAHESAEKEAETDAMKRALMTFGNQFGLALYDKAQANVEAPARPAVASARPTPSSTGDDLVVEKLSEIRDRLHRALSLSNRQLTPDIILKTNKADLEHILDGSPKTHARLLTYAEERNIELGLKPPPSDTGSGEELTGEP